MIIKKQRHNEQLVMRQIARQDEDKLYLCVSSPTIKDKPVSKRNINTESKDQKYQRQIVKLYIPGANKTLEAERR